MDDKLRKNELFQTSHIVILICYTILSVILIGESLLLSWETWALVLIIVALSTAWIIHMQQKLSSYSRLWIYSLLMMATFFFYGIHLTSTFDLAPVMAGVIILYTMTGIKSLVILCQATYMLTFLYDLVKMYRSGVEFDSLMITRSMLHIALILMVGWLARIIIERWAKVLLKSNEEITELKEVTGRLNDFLANVSHEIRTPANAVIGLTELYIDKDLEPQLKSDLISVRDAGIRISEQISDMLDYSEIDSGGLKNNLEEYMISSVVQDITARVTPFIPGGVELIFDVDPDIPCVLKSDVGKLNKILYHLIKNSLKYTVSGGVCVSITAEKESYGVNLDITVQDTGIGMNDFEMEHAYEGFFQGNSAGIRAGGLGLGLSVVSGFVSSLGGFMLLESESGEGTTVRVSLPQVTVEEGRCMSVKDKESLCLGAFLQFEKFTNVSVREYYQTLMRHVIAGLEIPIYVADSLEQLDELNSSIKMTHLLVGIEEYEENRDYLEKMAKETVVVVACSRGYLLPADSRAIFMEKPVSSFRVTELLNVKNEDIHKQTEQIHIKDVLALVVDDEPMNLTVAKEIFSLYGMEVDTVHSGFEAIEACHQKAYDIIFMDHMMPQMNGIDTAKRIRSSVIRNKNNLPIIALTANAVSTAKEMFFSEGFDGFISKPIERTELERVLKRVIPESKISYEQIREPEGIAHDVTMTLPDNVPDKKPLSITLDMKMGLSYCAGDEDFYRSLLADYALDTNEKKQNLIRAFEASDSKGYEIKIHALKSTSKMIGAMQLYEMAYELEKAASAGYLDAERHASAMELYSRLAEEIAKYLDIQLPSPNYIEEEQDTGEEVFEFLPEGN